VIGKEPMNVLILGVGNILLGDEGVGIHALAELERHYLLPDGVELLDGGTAGIELLRHIAGRDLCIIIDAMQSGAPPGTVAVFRDRQVGARLTTRISPHQLGLSDLLAAAALIGETPKRVVLVGIEPASLEPGLTLSPPAAAAIPGALAEVEAELRACGLELHRRPQPADDLRFFWEEQSLAKTART